MINFMLNFYKQSLFLSLLYVLLYMLVTCTYHGQEDTKLRVESHIVAVCEDERLLSLLLRSQDDSNLLGCYGQHRQVDTVKLVKTSPRS